MYKAFGNLANNAINVIPSSGNIFAGRILKQPAWCEQRTLTSGQVVTKALL